MKKTLEEKIEEIKETLEKEEITRQEINCNAEYCVSQRIRKGQGITEKSADRLLSKIQKIRTKRKKVPKSLAKVPIGVKEIEIEDVIDKNSHKIKASSKSEIEKKEDVFSLEQARVIANLKEENKHLKQENLFLKGELELKNKDNQQLREKLDKSFTVIDSSITVKDNGNAVIEKINHHEEVIKEVLGRIKNLEEEIAIEKSATRKEKDPAYHGFSLSKLSSGYWQAVRRMKGKPQCVYIGKDVTKAQEKIEKWLLKNYPDTLKEEQP